MSIMDRFFIYLFKAGSGPISSHIETILTMLCPLGWRSVARKATGRKFGRFLEFFGRGGKWTTVYLHSGNGSPYGSFTIATFVSKTVSDIDTQQEIESILSVSRRPRWPRQVQSRLSHVIVIGVITLNFANVNTALSTAPEEGRDLGVCCIRQSQNPKSNNLYLWEGHAH